MVKIQQTKYTRKVLDTYCYISGNNLAVMFKKGENRYCFNEYKQAIYSKSAYDFEEIDG